METSDVGCCRSCHRCHTHVASDYIVIRPPTLPVQEGLVALWDDTDESTRGSTDGGTPHEPAVSSKPLIDKLWRRVAHNWLVIGVTLTTDRSV